MITAWCATTSRRSPSWRERLGGQQAADPQRDVGPALAAGRPVVELAEQVRRRRASSGNCSRMPAPVMPSNAPKSRSRSRSSVRTRQSEGHERRAAAVLRARRNGELSTAVGRSSSASAASHRPSASAWPSPGVRQLDVGVADVELEPAGARLVRAARRRRCPCSRRAAPARARTGPVRVRSRTPSWTATPPIIAAARGARAAEVWTAGERRARIAAVTVPTDLPVLAFADQAAFEALAGGRARPAPRAST